MARSDLYGEQMRGDSMRRTTEPAFLAKSFFINLDVNSVWQGVL